MLTNGKIRDLFYVAGLLISMGALWGTTSAKVSSLEKKTSSLEIQIVPITERLARMEQKIDDIRDGIRYVRQRKAN